MRNFHYPGRSSVISGTAMVATSHPLAASEALQILRDGGNAVDAAIAGALLLGGCEPHMTGIGGDCFALIKPAGSNNIVAVNGSGRAPKATDAEALRADGLTKIDAGHPASITLPGAVDAFCQMSEQHGKLGLDRILQPAIRHFDAGIPIAPRVSFDISPIGPELTEDAKRFFMKAGKAYALGDKLALPGQAEVLRRIAKTGRTAFYEGEVADDMVAALSAIGGGHSLDDFGAVRSDWGTPLSGPYRDVSVFEHPPNGQGATALLLCRILEHFDIARLDPIGSERLHLEAEATKLAYDARNRILADPDHTTRLDAMLSQDMADQMAAMIDMKRAMPAPSPLTEEPHRDTVLITVVDRDGMAVTLIYSLFGSFGSGVASPKFGILFHNRGSGFNLIQGHPNEIGPGKRPMHTIIPAMRATEGQIDMAFGVMGGQYQATGHARLMSNLTDFGMDVQDAIDAPRSFWDPITGELQVEHSLPEATCAGLVDRGHRLVRPRGPIGGAQAIQIDHARGLLLGGSDPRKDGIAIGY